MDSGGFASDAIFAIDWSRPVILAALPAVLLLPLARRFGVWPALSRTGLALRALFLALIVLAAAGPQRLDRAPAASPVLVLDVSASLTTAQRDWVRTTLTQRIRPAADWPVIAFGGESRRLVWSEASALLAAPDRALHPGATDLEAALRRAVEDVPDRAAYVFSDGWETRGDAASLLPTLARRGLPIHVFPPPAGPPPNNVALRRMSVPSSRPDGQDVAIAVAVENTNPDPIHGRLSVHAGDAPVWEHDAELRPGASLLTHTIQTPDRGLVPLRATFLPADAARDAMPDDNRATAWIHVAPTEKILLLSAAARDNRYLRKALHARGFDVTEAAVTDAPGELPAWQTFDGVILNNVAHAQLPATLHRGVDAFVKGGGGLVMIGGERSLGLGQYAGTEVERVLPVRMIPPRREVRRTAIVLVIDKSGSMRRQRKLAYAKLGARAVARNLEDTDLFGVIGFDKTPFVVAPLDYVGKTRARLDARIDRLKPSGGTLLLPALREAKRQLERSLATRKHVVVLTDGETGGSGSAYLDLASDLRTRLGITVSAVAVGTRPNLRLLARLADYGGGAFHHTTDPSTLPALFLDELDEPAPEKTLVERALRPIPEPGSPLLGDIAEARLPAVTGYVQTRLKKGARADLSVRDADQSRPLLASWSYGKGRAVVFTSDANGRWSAPWIGWGRYGRFWEQAVRWSLADRTGRGQGDPPFSVEIGHDETGLLVEAFYHGSDAPPAGPLTATVSGPSGRGHEIVLESLAPGQYRGVHAHAAPGDYILSVGLPKGERHGPVGYTVPARHRRETPRPQVNLALLEALAAGTGGRLDPDLTAFRPSAGPVRRTPLLPFLLGLALAVYVLEIFVRQRAAARLPAG